MRNETALGRRRVLQIAAASAIATVPVGTTAGQEDGPSVTIEDQVSDGQSVVIDELVTDVDASVFVLDEDGETIGGSGVTFDAGDSESALEVELEEPLEATQTVTVLLFESNGGVIAEDTAVVTVDEEAVPQASVSVDTQYSDGETVVIREVTTDVNASLFVLDENDETIGGTGVTFAAGDSATDLEVQLEEPLESMQAVTVLVFESNGSVIAEDEAVVIVDDERAVPSVTIEEQESDGASVVLEELTTDVDASVFVLDEEGETIGGSGVTFDVGDAVTELTVALDDPLETSQSVTAVLFESNGGVIAEDEAHVDVVRDDETGEEPDDGSGTPGRGRRLRRRRGWTNDGNRPGSGRGGNRSDEAADSRDD